MGEASTPLGGRVLGRCKAQMAVGSEASFPRTFKELAWPRSAPSQLADRFSSSLYGYAG
jgi:hypothetical protein